jgi:hypothetical protein
MPPLPERLSVKFEIADGCWEWSACKDRHGYGIIWDTPTGNNLRAHRVVYEALVGPIPSGLVLDHLCRNPSCVNPTHMEPVTHRENILRGVGPAAINASKTTCGEGHPLAGENLYIHPTSGARECRICRRKKKAHLIVCPDCGISRVGRVDSKPRCKPCGYAYRSHNLTPPPIGRQPRQKKEPV